MTQATINRGRRQSTAFCYLDPARNRQNLHIQTDATVERLIIDNKRCVGITYSINGKLMKALSSRETIICAGTINSPKLLELSGIGKKSILEEYGIDLVHESPGVGENLRDHYSPRLKYAITEKDATFSERGNGFRLMIEAMKYVFLKSGFISLTTVPLRMYFRTREGLETPDATISFMPFLTERINRTRAISKKPGITMSANVLRPESLGSIHIKSTDPALSLIHI